MTQKDYIVVAVSPFYTGLGWVDTNLDMTFKPTQKIIAIRIEKDKNLSGIKNAVRLNHLLLLEGELEITDDAGSEEIYETTLADEDKLEKIRTEMTEAKKEKELLEKENKKLRDRINELEFLTAKSKEKAEKVEVWDKREAEALTVNQIKDVLKEAKVNFNENEKKNSLTKKLIGLEK